MTTMDPISLVQPFGSIHFVIAENRPYAYFIKMASKRYKINF